jgi:hypothetical protein
LNAIIATRKNPAWPTIKKHFAPRS